MSIVQTIHTTSSLRRSGTFISTTPRLSTANASLLRSLRAFLKWVLYKHPVPPGLFLLGVAVVLCSISNSRVSALTTPKAWSEAIQSVPDYSKFKHDNPQHARLPCLLCHRRENNAARPTLPGKSNHAPCAGCHAQQFNNPDGPMCTICHTNIQAGTVKGFPRLLSFNVKFDHARHSAVGAACSACHRSNRRWDISFNSGRFECPHDLL